MAERLGGSRFVEALRAHGYSAGRIFLVHVVGYNLRPVVVRQGAETMMHVVFLEIALSYLALAENQPSFTHGDALMSWADLLKLGYPSLIPSLGYDSGHALVLALGLLGVVTAMAIAIAAQQNDDAAYRPQGADNLYARARTGRRCGDGGVPGPGDSVGWPIGGR